MTAVRDAETVPAAAVLCVEAAVTSVAPLCPSFRRITLAGPELAGLSPALLGAGNAVRCRDADIKLLVPPPGREPERADLSRGLREGWFARPTEERGWMRTYTVRGVRRTTFCGTLVPELVMDVVVHDGLAGRRPARGRSGPVPVRADEDPAEPRAWSVAAAARADVPYVFLAGESGTVRALRRLCVDAAGIPKDHVSFMGYWRQGQAES